MNLKGPHDSRTIRHWGLHTSTPKIFLMLPFSSLSPPARTVVAPNGHEDRIGPTPHTHIGMYEGQNPHDPPLRQA
jgi:hypothetical protein